MEKCPVCLDGKIATRYSTFGEEKFCEDCRRITKSAMFNFEFKTGANVDAVEGVQPCKGPDGRPGVKGPGKKARCFVYDDGDEESKSAAHKKALNSSYSFQHRKNAAIIASLKNGVAYFDGAPSSLMPPDGSQANPSPTGAQDLSNTGQSPIGEATAPGGMQPGNLNSNNPINSGTTASKRLAELIQEDVTDHMGPGFCTEHMTHDECNHGKKSY